jgi:methyltransferase (TIGR00027 family)
MSNVKEVAPESTAVRVALWRALHVLVDVPPHVLEDEVGLRLVAPDDKWRERPDMDPAGTIRMRASIVARARFIEDLVAHEAERGVLQYVILGAGLDTFSQRRWQLASRLTIFEVDQLGPQTWKRQRLIELGLGVPDFLRFVSVNFEEGPSWRQRLKEEGFDEKKPALVASTGVSMYLRRETVIDTLKEVSRLAANSTLAMTFMPPIEYIEPEMQALQRIVTERARASGTPFVSLFSPTEIESLAREAGFREARTVSAPDLAQRYFAGRTDGLKPSNGEQILLAKV